MNRPRLYLASASPRRYELLRQIGLAPRRVLAEVAEHSVAGESACAHVARLAQAKARAAARRLEPETEFGMILAADTAVVIDGEPLGKPRGPQHALEMLQRLRGRDHEVLTGVFLLRTDCDSCHADVESTRVRFKDLGDATLSAYVEGGEPRDKAGAYGIQGRGALLVERIEGSWPNVVGLPVERLPEWSRRIGIDLVTMIDWRGP